MKSSRFPFWVLVLWSPWRCCNAASQSIGCPWQEERLSLWNHSSSWPFGTVPAENDSVVISPGKRILLNVQPPMLATLIIESGAALIWDNVDGLQLNTHFILIRGEFHIGSEKCRFTKKAHIRLYGKSDSKYYVEEEFGRKFIGVAAGGTLELHGPQKTSWSKLAQTIQPSLDIQCAVIYDHSDMNNVMGLERQPGAHGIVWNEDGSVMDFNIFKTTSEFSNFFATIPDGKVVAVFAVGPDGIGTPSDIANVVPTLQNLGGSIIAQVAKGDSYSFLARKGDRDSVKEFTKVHGQKDPAPQGFLHLHDDKRGVVFQVSSSTLEEKQYFRVLNEDAAYPVLTLKDEVVGWEVGDEVLVTSTDFDWKQAETRRIVRCGKGCSSKRQIRVDDPFKYLHFGNFTFHVDERAEVAMLTRNILVEGVMEDGCYSTSKDESTLCQRFKKDTFGGHVLIARGHKSVHIEGVELYHMGQQKHKGAYPLHFHMCDDIAGVYVRQNSIHDSFSRCLTIHGTHSLHVSDNVCYKHHGHGLLIEDGVEENNTINGNLIAGTDYGSLLLSDTRKDWCPRKWMDNCGDLSSYWMTHPNNAILNNVAAGGEGNGFMYIFADMPLGLSLARQKELQRRHHPKDMPITFTGNVAHSNQQNGVFMDGKMSTGTGMENKGKVPENGVIQTENEYDPHLNGKPVWTEMSYGTYYKNVKDNVWIKGGNIRVSYSTLADASEGLSGGTTLTNSGVEVNKCIFIGETENKGVGKMYPIPPTMTDSRERKMHYFPQSFPGFPTDSLTAISIYQGPIIIKNNFFDKFETKTWCLNDPPLLDCGEKDHLIRHAGAISFKRSNNYPSMTSSYIENNTFGFCDNELGGHWVFQGGPSLPDWSWKDGNKAVYFYDKDGKLTGTVNASVVPDFPLYKGPECLVRPDWGDLMICPYRYIKLEVLGSKGNLGSKLQRQYPLIIKRDDPPYDDPFSIKGEIRNEYLLQTHRSYLIDFNATLKDAAFPTEFKLYGYGVEKQDVVRIGLCQPKDVESYEISMDYPAVIINNATWVQSLLDLDADTTGNAFFYDKHNGILFFKMLSFHQDTNETQQCPEGKCWKLKIIVKGGTLETLRSCAHINIPPYISKMKTLRKPTIQKCPRVTTPEGLGAVIWEKENFIEYNDYSVPCHQPEETQHRGARNYLGCFLETVNKDLFQPDLTDMEFLELVRSMTATFCTDRCYYRGYKFAGLSRGRRCTCANIVMSTVEYVGNILSDCSLACAGDSNQKCGGMKHLSVWTTGL